MNEVFENEIKFAALFKFYNRYKTLILSSIFLIIIILVANISYSQISKFNNEKASLIYIEWVSQDLGTESGNAKAEDLLTELISSYRNTGYTKIALLNHASYDAKNGNNILALEKFTTLIDLTDGISGDKLFNKLARVNSARLLYAINDYEKSLKMLEKYSSSSTNAYIHELTGDILHKKDQSLLAIDQYLLAKEKYTDEASRTIVSMKLSNIKSQ